MEGVSGEVVFYDSATIDLADGSETPSGEDDLGMEQFAGYAETLFPEGFRVGVRPEGRRRVAEESLAFGELGRLSPDRSTLFDVSTWPTPAVAYDAETGQPRAIDAPWRHFTLGGWVDEDTFWGAAEQARRQRVRSVARAHQVVTCELATLTCVPASRVFRSDRGLTTGLRLEYSGIVGADPGSWG